MTTAYPVPPAPMAVERLADWIRRDGSRAITVLFDPAIAGQPVATTVTERVGRAGVTPRVLTATSDSDLGTVESLAESLGENELVIAVGGGTVVDQAKLAVLFRRSPEAHDRVRAPQRSGMVALPPHLGTSVRVVAVPTTLGTGTELSTVACVTHAGGKRLVTGPCLRPAASVLTTEATGTLPVRLVSEGVLEALFRTVSPYVGDHADLPEPDALTEDLAVRLVRVGDRVRRLRSAGEPVDGATRLRIAELSGQSQIGDTNLGRDPYAVKGWLLGNELSSELGLSKVHAIAALWPVLWERIAQGDTRLGSARRLARIWDRILATDPYLPTDPAAGIAALTDAWLVDRDIVTTPERLDAATSRVMRSWGAGLPMLGGLRTHEVRDLFARAVREDRGVPDETSAPVA
ncbi:daptide-type RiPP biosynthesis dehydogenase [Nocardiopsis sp. FIRDI 009]|uniref:daptide-type RiPP biosynthesis dehydogenase n=1 Tax=Nocardiopsis sp. FIRDI 009 TaxID=714197 RepID=UPI000E266248|nr:daptide-type RiPP biosynthesis dehydogenase [Nocardiopsis sp. FIRDI 009]